MSSQDVGLWENLNEYSRDTRGIDKNKRKVKISNTG